MSVLKSKCGSELIVTCTCGCGDAFHISVCKDDEELYGIVTYLNGNWYRDQEDSALRAIGRKLRKIWRIIRNRDHHYSEICMTPSEWDKFKAFVNGA
ncbi:MAG: hypothetical protein IJP02_03010 [Oscillospiraceae bacterium]|nr:hypothetical protein [Oscillospiraceae bacterium]